MFEIIKDAPPLQHGGIKYPFARMQVGDSFDAPRDKGKTTGGCDRRQNNIGSAARCYAKSHNPAAKFTTRLMDENTVRCQRTA